MEITNLPLKKADSEFLNPTFWLNPLEYSKITSEINLLYEANYKGKAIATHASFGIDGRGYIYWFENHGFNNYNIYQRVIDNR